MAKHLVILDGYSLLYRAFFATRYLSTSDGRPTNALYGFVSMLFFILEHDRPDAIVVALDAPGPTFRHKEYAEYKGTRRETPDELKVQLKVSRELITGLGIPVVEAPGFEADDVVGTIACLGEKNGYDTTIVTGDLDSLQLVDEHVRVMTMRQGVTEVIFYTPKEVQDRYGFGPEFIPDYKAIVGDTSDNIPGVPGIGDKGASTLISKFGSIENLLEKWDEVEPKFQKKIDPVREQMAKSKWLATIKTDAPVEYDFAPFLLTPERFEAAKSFLERFELRSHVRRMEAILGRYRDGAPLEREPVVEVEAEAITATVRDEKSPERLISWVGSEPYALVFETISAQLGMFEEPERAAYVAKGKEVRKTSTDAALALFAKAPDLGIFHDAKPFLKERPDVRPPRVRFDSLLAGYVLQSGRSNYALRDLIQGYLEAQPPTTSGDLAAALSLLETPMRERLEKEGQTSVLDDIELPLTPILADLEAEGIAVDPQVLRDFSGSLEKEIEATAQRIYAEAAVTFNIGSPKQLGEVLFEKMQLQGVKKGKNGYPTGAEVLQPLAPAYPIIAEILTWRELSKLKSTYADSLPRMIREDGRIHTTFNQAVAATGRLSSIDPNLQNIPIRTELGRKIRKAFVCKPGTRLASFDYSQIELRVLAHMCEDENLVEAFQTGIDVHTVTAGLMFGLEHDQVTKDQRRLAKLLNYAVLYGVTEWGLANQLGAGFSVSEAKGLIEQYRERFPKVRGFTQETIQEARGKGFTTTLCGRRRYFPDIHNSNRNERMYAERQAMNAPIQGTASDMIKLAMLRVAKTLEGAKTRMLLQVHDELVFELAEGEDHLIEPIRRDMEAALVLNVPVEVDAKVGANWDDMDAVTR